jgi:large subunit ribosomal protein L29
VEYIGFNPPSEKWMNPEMEEATEKVQIYLQTCDKDAAYWLENERKYLYVQTVSDGYDYTFYDEEYKELDGGLYSDSELTFKSALQEIMLDEFRSSIDECKVINSEEFLEKAEEIAEKKVLLFTLRQKLKTMQLTNPNEIKEVRRDIARINTAISAQNK